IDTSHLHSFPTRRSSDLNRIAHLFALIVVPGHRTICIDAGHTDIAGCCITTTTKSFGRWNLHELLTDADSILLVMIHADNYQPRRELDCHGRRSGHAVVDQVDIHIKEVDVCVQLLQVGIERVMSSFDNPYTFG